MGNTTDLIQGRIGDFEPDSWQWARERLNEIGLFPASFTTCVRHLLDNQKKNDQESTNSKVLDETSRFMVLRFMRSPTVKAHMYFLALTYFPQAIEGRSYVSVDHLLGLFSPVDIASVLSLIYLSHRVERRCNRKEWAIFSRSMQNVMDVAGFLALKVPGCRIGEALLVSGIRYLGLATCLPLDVRKFQTYRRALPPKKMTFDQREENLRWHCTHVQIAALLLQEMGFGVSYSEDFKSALALPLSRPLNERASRLRLLTMWADAFSVGAQLPAIAGEDKFSASEDSLREVMSYASTISRSGSVQCWLLRGREDISRHLVPALYRTDERDMTLKSRGPATVIEEDDYLRYDELPEHVRKVFSAEELEKLCEEILDLIDQEQGPATSGP